MLLSLISTVYPTRAQCRSNHSLRWWRGFCGGYRECDLAPVLVESYGSAQAGQDPVGRRATVAAAAAAEATGTGQPGKLGRRKKRK